MTNFTTNLMIAAAALVAAAGAANAQTTMEAKIPFDFNAAGAFHAAGTYRVQTTTTASGGPLIVIRDVQTAESSITYSYPDGNAKEAWKVTGNPVLSFRCAGERCVLSSVWLGNGAPDYRVPAPKFGKQEAVREAEVTMHTVKGD